MEVGARHGPARHFIVLLSHAPAAGPGRASGTPVLHCAQPACLPPPAALSPFTPSPSLPLSVPLPLSAGDVYGLIQILFLLAVYFKILGWASDQIAEGSELLLLIPAIRGAWQPQGHVLVPAGCACPLHGARPADAPFLSSPQLRAWVRS